MHRKSGWHDTLNEMVSKFVVSISLYYSCVYLHHVDSGMVANVGDGFMKKEPKYSQKANWEIVGKMYLDNVINAVVILLDGMCHHPDIQKGC